MKVVRQSGPLHSDQDEISESTKIILEFNRGRKSSRKAVKPICSTQAQAKIRIAEYGFTEQIHFPFGCLMMHRTRNRRMEL